MNNEKKPDEEKIIDTFMKNSGEKIIVSFTTYKGGKFIDLRVYYEAKDGWRRTTKGLTFRRDLVFDLKAAVDKAAQEFEKESPGSEGKE